MNYHDIRTDDMLNGDGLRVVLFVSGCSHHCPGCHNPETWDPKSGIYFDYYAEKELMAKLKPDYISGLTISGGDPMHPCNEFQTYHLSKRVKELYPEKTVWVYTGYKYEDLGMRTCILKYVDVLVDGRFEQDKASVEYPWAGSTNQRVIDLNKTREVGEVCLYV